MTYDLLPKTNISNLNIINTDFVDNEIFNIRKLIIILVIQFLDLLKP